MGPGKDHPVHGGGPTGCIKFMKLVVINGNRTSSVSQYIHNAAEIAALPGTQIETLTPKNAPPTVQGYWDGELSAVAVCEAISSHDANADAFIIACFSDPGLFAARELSLKPVVGIAESAMITAIQLGSQFGILTPLRKLRPVLADLVHRYGFDQRCGGIQTVEMSVLQAAHQSNSTLDAFVAAGKKLIEEQHVEVLILGGAVFAGLEIRMAAELGVPVLDPVKCGVVQAQALVKLGLSSSRIGGFSKIS